MADVLLECHRDFLFDWNEHVGHSSRRIRYSFHFEKRSDLVVDIFNVQCSVLVTVSIAHVVKYTTFSSMGLEGDFPPNPFTEFGHFEECFRFIDRNVDFFIVVGFMQIGCLPSSSIVASACLVFM